MILAILTIIMAYIWLLKETNFLRVNLAQTVKPEPLQHRNHNPKLDEPDIKTQIKTLKFPKLIAVVVTEIARPKIIFLEIESAPKFSTRFIGEDEDTPMYKINRRNRQERRLVRRHNMSY